MVERSQLKQRTVPIIFCCGLCCLVCAFVNYAGLHGVVLPRKDIQQHGWAMHFYQPSHPVGVPGYEVILDGNKTVALNPDFRRADGYICFFVENTGQYQFKFALQGTGWFGVDGIRLLYLTDETRAPRGATTWIRLSKGWHLARVSTFIGKEGGWFAPALFVPPAMRGMSFADDMVATPRLGNLDTWWAVLSWSRRVSFVIGGFALLLTLLLLLPLASSKKWYSVPLMLSMIILPAWLIPSRDNREPFVGEAIHRKLKKIDPEIVFIGNSMLWSRIDDAYLTELRGNRPVTSIINFGGLSAIHYLAFKYLLLPSGVTPKLVVFFFRDNVLTLPRERTTGPFFEPMIERLTPAEDPVFQELVYGHHLSTTAFLQQNVERMLPLVGVQGVRTALRDIALSTVTFCWDESAKEQEEFLDAMNKRLGFSKKGQRQGKALEANFPTVAEHSFDFQRSIVGSFLPHFFTLAEENRMKLAFIRVQRRPGEKGCEPDSPELEKYLQDLQAYLEDHGALYYDFTGDPELPLSVYNDGDHIADQRYWTELFLRRVGPLLP